MNIVAGEIGEVTGELEQTLIKPLANVGVLFNHRFVGCESTERNGRCFLVKTNSQHVDILRKLPPKCGNSHSGRVASAVDGLELNHEIPRCDLFL